MKISKTAYDKLIKEDIEWLRTNNNACNESVHIISVLKRSVGFFYPTPETNNPTPEECYNCPHKTKPCDSRQVDCPNAVKPNKE